MHSNQQSASYPSSNAFAAIGAATRDLAPLDVAMSGTQNAIDELQSCISELAGRLECVLKPEPPMPGQAGDAKLAAAPEPHSPAVQRMQAQARHIATLIYRVNDLARRVES